MSPSVGLLLPKGYTRPTASSQRPNPFTETTIHYYRNVVPSHTMMEVLASNWRKVLSMPRPRRGRGRRRDETDVEDWEDFSVYPDIIVHRRLSNEHNLLVVEVKKSSSDIPHDIDFEKLSAFTATDDCNPYHYLFGLFILLYVRTEPPRQPELTWFTDGEPELRAATRITQSPQQLALPFEEPQQGQSAAAFPSQPERQRPGRWRRRRGL